MLVAAAAAAAACRFYGAMAVAQDDDKLSAFVVQTILTVDDFLMFKAMMVKRNIDLTNQVRRAQAWRGVAVVVVGQAPASTCARMGGLSDVHG